MPLLYEFFFTSIPCKSGLGEEEEEEEETSLMSSCII